jgi:hypothetical protein
MCWMNLHWWRSTEGWGIRACRFCGKREQAWWDSETGLYWVPVP